MRIAAEVEATRGHGRTSNGASQTRSPGAETADFKAQAHRRTRGAIGISGGPMDSSTRRFDSPGPVAGLTLPSRDRLSSIIDDPRKEHDDPRSTRSASRAASPSSRAAAARSVRPWRRARERRREGRGQRPDRGHPGDRRRRIAAAGSEGLAIAGDATDEADADRIVARPVDRFGRLDIVINAVGGGAGKVLHPAEAYPRDAWDWIMELNVRSTIVPTMAAARR